MATAVAEFFCLYETGVEDRLLIDGSLEAWSQLVGDAIAHTSGLVFQTSGSTGEPKACHHRWEDIEAEARALQLRINECVVPKRVVAWLPLHHLYGFMLGVAYPALNGLEPGKRSAPAKPKRPLQTNNNVPLLLTNPQT